MVVPGTVGAMGQPGVPARAAEQRAVAVIGAGQHGRVVASVLEAAGSSIRGFYDDAVELWGTFVGRSSVAGPPSEIPRGTPAIIAIGDNETRKRLATTLELEWVSVVHPFSWLHPDVRLGGGTVVCPGVTIQVEAEVGAHVILNNRVGVGHGARVADYCHLTVSHLGGGAHADEGAFLGIGSVILPRVRVGAWATVGAGAVVLEDVRPGATVVGNPARETMARPRGTLGSG